jgi:hypothetical protein
VRLSLRSIHAKNALILALASAGAMTYGVPAVCSVAVGGGIQVVNLRGLERAVGWLVSHAPARPGGLAQLVLGGRFVAVLAAVGAALWLLPIEPIPFVVGLSTSVPAVIWHGLSTAALEREKSRA